MATVMATATAMAMVMVMLKMDENVNLRLERHVNRAFFFYCVQFSSWHKFFIFFKILGSE